MKNKISNALSNAHKELLPHEAVAIKNFIDTIAKYKLYTITTKKAVDQINTYIYSGDQDIIIDYLNIVNSNLILEFGTFDEVVSLHDNNIKSNKSFVEASLFKDSIDKLISYDDKESITYIGLLYLLRLNIMKLIVLGDRNVNTK